MDEVFLNYKKQLDLMFGLDCKVVQKRNRIYLELENRQFGYIYDSGVWFTYICEETFTSQDETIAFNNFLADLTNIRL